MWIDELYDKTVIALAKLFSIVADLADRFLWDGLVRIVGVLGRLVGILSAAFDEHGINATADRSAASTRGIGRLLAARHTGQVQTYMGAIGIGMLALLLLYAWLA